MVRWARLLGYELVMEIGMAQVKARDEHRRLQRATSVEMPLQSPCWSHLMATRRRFDKDRIGAEDSRNNIILSPEPLQDEPRPLTVMMAHFQGSRESVRWIQRS